MRRNLNNIMAKIQARQAGAQEALFLSNEGYVAECTGDNIVVVKDGQLMVPVSNLDVRTYTVHGPIFAHLQQAFGTAIINDKAWWAGV